ncbi:nuclease domain-containing protein [Janthinobacterium sp. DSP2-3-3]|uniref:nuclease domain-containing protein n=1 Tax=Janthinobacterium sp. DSP2-3-3 TaxID=2804596 RepID=UPI003CF555C9
MMRRSPLKPGAGLKRTAFKQKVPSSSTGILRVAAAERKAPPRKAKLKAKGPKMTPIRRAARGQDCTLRLAVCNFDPDTTVLCHSNFLADGKGMGLKTPDTAAAFGCSACHDVLDGRRTRPADLSMAGLEAAFRAAVSTTHEILKAEGLL